MNDSSVIGFHHFNIKAIDFETTTNFYKVLGFEEVYSWSLPDFNIAKCTMMYHSVANVYLEICDKDADMPTQGRKKKEKEPYVENAILHICFTVTNAKEAHSFAIKNGAKSLIESNEIELKNSKNGKILKVINSLVYSPNGEVIEFLEDSFRSIILSKKL